MVHNVSNPPTLGLKECIKDLLGERGFAYIAKAKELKAAGKDVISFGVGQPDIPTFDHIVEEGIKALKERFTGYTETQGIKELRAAIAEYLNERYGSDVREDEVLVTIGTKGAAFLALAAYLKPGDEVIVPEPTYPVYSEAPKFIGAKPVYIPLKWEGEDRGFSLDIEEIEKAISSKTKALVVNNPHNPTGAIFKPAELDALMDLARRHNLVVFVDEIYDNFIYEESTFKSFMEFPDWRDYVIYLNGFSKTFSMTGWRVGYLVARSDVVRNLTKLAVNVWSCPPSMAQRAAIAALKGDWKPVRDMVNLFRERRDIMVAELRKVPGFEVWRSAGAFYAFPRVRRLLDSIGMNVEEFVDYLIDSKYVVTLPGTAFPDTAGKDYIRFSFCISKDKIIEGAKRIKDTVEDLLASRFKR